MFEGRLPAGFISAASLTPKAGALPGCATPRRTEKRADSSTLRIFPEAALFGAAARGGAEKQLRGSRLPANPVSAREICEITSKGLLLRNLAYLAGRTARNSLLRASASLRERRKLAEPLTAESVKEAAAMPARTSKNDFAANGSAESHRLALPSRYRRRTAGSTAGFHS